MKLNAAQLTRFGNSVRTLSMLAALALTAARAQSGESFYAGISADLLANGVAIGAGENMAMLAFNGLLLSSALLAFAARTLSGAPTRHLPRGLLAAALCFILAFALSLTQASDKNTAFIAGLNWICPMLWSLELIRWLDQPWKRHLTLALIIASGITLAWRCYEQSHWDVPETLQQIEKDPDLFLTRHGIQPGTLKAHQFLSRARSQDIGGYFNVSNTAASFFILSITAAASLLGLIKPNRSRQNPADDSSVVLWLISALLIAPQLYALWLTQSLGGMMALAAALMLWLTLTLFRRQLTRHWRLSLAVAALLIILGTLTLIAYGLAHDRLPSNSLWVRWQYWRAAASMIADHWLCGVGPENFGHYFPRYMDPAASEVVRDPHCLPLALWSQWGLLGFLGLIILLTTAAITIARPHFEPAASLAPARASDRTGQLISAPRSTWLFIPVAALILFAARYLCSGFSQLDPQTRQSVILVMIFVPALIWLLALAAAGYTAQAAATHNPAPFSVPVIRILACGLAGFLLHNMIDFAVFQPGVLSTFFMLTAALFAEKIPVTDPPAAHIRSSHKMYAAAALIAIALFWLILFIPARSAESTLLRARIMMAASLNPNSQPDSGDQIRSLKKAAALALTAAEKNHFDPRASLLAAQTYQQLWQMTRQELYLDLTEQQCLAAQTRDPHNFRYQTLLANLFMTASADLPPDHPLSQKAFCYLCGALRLNPVRSDLMVELADRYRLLNQPAQAAALYQKALDLELAYQAQQKKMHGLDEPVVPRLTPELQSRARAALQNLAPPNSNP